MAGICERCMTAEARSPHDLYCDDCEQAIREAELTPGTLMAAWHALNGPVAHLRASLWAEVVRMATPILDRLSALARWLGLDGR